MTHKSLVVCLVAAVVAILACLAPTSRAQLSPAVAVGISSAGVTTIANGILPAVMEAVRTSEFPGESGKESGYKYEISKIRINRLTYQDLILNMQQANVIHAGIRKLTVALNLHWSYKKSKIPWLPRGSGTADVSMEGCTIDGAFLVTRVNNRLQVVLQSATTQIDNISVKTHGSLFSWLYNLIIRLFKSTIRKTIENAISDGFREAVNVRAAQILATMEYIKPVSSWGVIDLSLPRDPTQYNSGAGASWTFPFNGEVYPASTRAPLNVVPRPNMPWTTGNRHFELNFSFFTINSAAAVWQQVKRPTSIVDGSNTPQGFPVAMTSVAWQPHIPQIYTKYGSSGIEIKTTLDSYPTAGFNGNQMIFNMAYLFTVTANGRACFTIRGRYSGAVSISVRDNAIVPRIDDATGLFDLVSSSIGTFSLKPAEFIFNAVVKLIALPAINNDLFAGFPLPTIAGLSFVQPEFSVRDGFVVAGFNVQYRP